jgi:xylan 1,4-beta-xylosidase
LQKLIWKEDDWPYAVNGFPEDKIFFSGMKSNVEDESGVVSLVKKYDDFEGRELAPEYHSLRIPADEFISLKVRPGCLRLYGQESISSTFRQSLIARRVQNFRFYTETCLEFYPDNFKQMAGLILRYNERNQYYLRLSRDEQSGSNALGMIIFKEGRMEMPVSPEVIVTDNRIYLSVEMVDRVIQFYYSIDRENWQPIGCKLESEALSDEMADPMGFTGMFVGIACQDLSGRRKHADFDYFLYEERK